MSDNDIQNLQPEVENPIQEPVIKTRKPKVYVKKGLDSRGRPPIENKTTEYGLPTDPDYFKKYYHQKLAQKVQCEQCLMFVCKVNLKKHTQSSYHQRFCKVIENNKPNVENV